MSQAAAAAAAGEGEEQKKKQARWDVLLRLLPIQASQAKQYLSNLSSRDYCPSSSSSESPLSPLNPRSKFGLLLATLTELATLFPPPVFGQEEKEKRKERLEEFFEWLKRNGCDKDELSNVYISKANGEEGDGVFASRDVKEGEPIVKIPEKLMMLATKAMNEDSLIQKLVAKDALLKQMPSLVLAMFLLNERRKGNDSSFWWPYIQILPDAAALSSTVFLMTPNHLESLSPSPAFEEALNILTTTALQYAHVNRLIKEVKEEAKESVNLYGYGEFMWAMAVVSSRQNPIPLNNKLVTLSLIPLFDMFNHSTGQITSYFDDKERALECMSMRDYKKGDQIYIFYGERPNSELLLFSGFVYSNNQCDNIKLRVSLNNSVSGSESEADKAKKVSFLEALSVKPKRTTPTTEYELLFSPSQINTTETGLMKFARVCSLNAEELRDASKTLESLKKGGVAPLSANHEDRTLQYIQQLLRQQLQRYDERSTQRTAADSNVVDSVSNLISSEQTMLKNGIDLIEAHLNKRKKQQQKRQNKKNKKKGGGD
eukprot:TRINITY_DN403_c0_g3_i1.p1 TRINITY_DN403_c0_g3~~TRINITY_DN403_c0_g3_i1.p1  ORF type:complete len:560 (-),score=205.26 TRINITY_DN403_c0_g3_i1:110-1738(-)